LQLDLQRLEQDINTKKEAILQMEAKIKDDKEKEKRNIQ